MVNFSTGKETHPVCQSTPFMDAQKIAYIFCDRQAQTLVFNY